MFYSTYLTSSEHLLGEFEIGIGPTTLQWTVTRQRKRSKVGLSREVSFVLSVDE
jgi:hypothetical protein